jgi:hypothetical protein
MDPNANLGETRRLLARMLDGDQPNDNYLDDAQRLAELARALDGWITGGGFLPDEWARRRGTVL